MTRIIYNVQQVNDSGTPSTGSPQYDSTGMFELPKNFSSLPYETTYNTNSIVYTRTSAGDVYVSTSTLDSIGREILSSGWVKQ